MTDAAAQRRRRVARLCLRLPQQSPAGLGIAFAGPLLNTGFGSLGSGGYTPASRAERWARVLRKTSGTASAEITTTASQMAPGHCFCTAK